MDAFNVADKRITELKNKLTEVERDKKSAEIALECAKGRLKVNKGNYVRPRTSWLPPKNISPP